MDRNLLYEALARGSIDLAAGDSTDGRIAALDLVVLEDDRRYFPPYEAVPLVRTQAPSTASRARARRSTASPAGSTRRPCAGSNHEIDGKKRDPAEVAREFLRSEGLIP